jgi:hypothetical protein
MFISKKRFQEEIAKAQEQTERKIYEQQRICQMEESMRHSIEEVRRDTYRMNEMLESKISHLEILLDKSIQKGCKK